MSEESETPRSPILVMAPLAPDMQVLFDLIVESGFEACAIGNGTSLATAVDDGADAVILTEEALTAASLSALGEALARQPDWSSLPILLLTADQAKTASADAELRAKAPRAQITVISRPAARGDVASAIEAAVSARASQLRIRELIDRHREAEERANFLLRELNHRVKNIYAVIGAIATQTIRSANGDPEKFLESFRGRVQALASVSDLLGRGGWSSAELAELIDATLTPILGDDLSGRVTTSGPNVTIPGHRATTLGLVLHELATNSIKYGALSNNDGTLTVRWRSDHDEVSIEWLERGGPEVRAPEGRGFGSSFIERAAHLDLGGEAKLDYQPEGLSCTISVALDRSD